MNINDLYIVKENPRLIHRLILDHSKGKLAKYFAGGFFIFFLTSWLPDIIGMIFPLNYFDLIADRLKNIDEATLAQLPTISVYTIAYMFLFVGVFQAGKALYVLTFIRNGSVEYRSIFEGFKFYLKTLGMSVAISIFVTAGFMLFVIPGILFWYHFRQSYYILADDPKKGVMQCLAESRLRMTGNKMNLFKLDLSYLGVLALGYIPVYAVAYFGLVSTETSTGIAIYLLLELPLAIALAYYDLGKAVFYELLVSQGFDNFKYAGQDAFRNYPKYTSNINNNHNNDNNEIEGN